jgi:hypothetical protein
MHSGPPRPYGREPSGRGAAPGQQARTRREAVPAATQPSYTATARTARPSFWPKECHMPCERSQEPGRNAAHCAGRPLQRQEHPEILSNRFAERISGTHP